MPALLLTFLKTALWPWIKAYLLKYATQEVAHILFTEAAEAIVKSTKTKWDDKTFKKIQQILDEEDQK